MANLRVEVVEVHLIVLIRYHRLIPEDDTNQNQLQVLFVKNNRFVLTFMIYFHKFQNRSMSFRNNNDLQILISLNLKKVKWNKNNWKDLRWG
jgi:hypothetical protein